MIVKILAKRLTGRLAFAKSGSDKIQISTAAMCGELEREMAAVPNISTTASRLQLQTPNRFGNLQKFSNGRNCD